MKRYWVVIAVLISIKGITQNALPASGNVGIGTPSPIANLHVLSSNDGGIGGTIAVDNQNITNGSGTAIYMGFQSSGLGFYGNRIVQQGYPSSTRSSTLLLQTHGAPADNANSSWTTGLTLFPSGNIGIGQGTIDNGNILQVGGSGSFAGNVGIGTAHPSWYNHGGNNIVAEISNSNTTLNSQAHLLLSTGATDANTSIGTISWAMPNITSGSKGMAFIAAVTGAYSTVSNPSTYLTFYNRDVSDNNWAERMRIAENGNVGIGTANPGSYKLAVEGKLGARKVVVTQAANWPDYVFDSSYTLTPLALVEQFIKDNKHLPDVPSAKEVTDKGLDVGDNQAVLLKKIEELTLYMIEMKKENEALKKSNENIKKEWQDWKINHQ
ncbi:hypothetical protein ACI6Q2_23165 [Chitinophagaceae bacterium LWZ2-11]